MPVIKVRFGLPLRVVDSAIDGRSTRFGDVYENGIFITHKDYKFRLFKARQ